MKIHNKVRLYCFFAFFAFVPFASAGNRFVDIGYPSPSHDWFGSEYQKTLSVITAQGGKNLPSLDGGDGEQIFRRMVNRENFSFARNLTIPFGQRFNDLCAVQQGANNIFKIYYAEAGKGRRLNRELIEQMVFSLRNSVVMLDLVDELLPSISKDDPKYAVKMEGLKGARKGLETVFSGAELTLGESKYFTSADLSLLLSGMAEVFPRLKVSFSEDFVHELKYRLLSRSKSFQSDADKAAFELIFKEMGISK